MKSNLLASAAFLLGTTAAAACSAPQRVTPADREQCMMAVDYFGDVVSDIERVVYGQTAGDLTKVQREIEKKLSDATNAIERDCANVPADDEKMVHQLDLIWARIKRMETSME